MNKFARDYGLTFVVAIVAAVLGNVLLYYDEREYVSSGIWTFSKWSTFAITAVMAYIPKQFKQQLKDFLFGLVGCGILSAIFIFSIFSYTEGASFKAAWSSLHLAVMTVSFAVNELIVMAFLLGCLINLLQSKLEKDRVRKVFE